MRRGVGKWIDNLQLLYDRTGPAVRNDERQRICMFRTNVNEMDVQPIDFSDELRQGVQSCLTLSPIVVCAPIARERLSRRELYALSCICDRLAFRPLCIVNASAQFGEFRFWKTHFRKRTNRIFVSRLFAASLCSNRWVMVFSFRELWRF